MLLQNLARTFWITSTASTDADFWRRVKLMKGYSQRLRQCLRTENRTGGIINDKMDGDMTMAIKFMHNQLGCGFCYRNCCNGNCHIYFIETEQ